MGIHKIDFGGLLVKEPIAKKKKPGLGARIGDELKQNYFMWANRRERQYERWGAFTNTDRMPTIMKWYGVDIAHNTHCNLCGNEAELTVETESTRLIHEKMGEFANIKAPEIGLDSFK